MIRISENRKDGSRRKLVKTKIAGNQIEKPEEFNG